MTGDGIPSSACTRRPDEIGADGFSSSRLAGTIFRRHVAAAAATAAAYERREGAATLMIRYLCDPQWFRDTASRGPTTIVAPESQFRTGLFNLTLRAMFASSNYNSHQSQQIFMRHADVTISADSNSTSRSYSNFDQR
ncbi:hypothetical protein F511_29717 [Dorcoceras hygrometricum]|uniref:Uncharacterized protein n=1 Tax=Dorcoceras hygrometricum TaxID=472368 RepID=A0A2Z7D0Y2_9LAMI|nr:hypothetical protein F511_29717 [Dorcoceras hygrometricum]